MKLLFCQEFTVGVVDLLWRGSLSLSSACVVVGGGDRGGGGGGGGGLFSLSSSLESATGEKRHALTFPT